MRVNLPITQVERDYPEDERLISETNLKGIITSANASFCAVAGFAHEELVGQPHNIVRHPDVPPCGFCRHVADVEGWGTLGRRGQEPV